MPKLRMKRDKGFTLINNTILRNKKIGSSPRGVYVTMMSMADGWNFTVRGLASIMGEGVTKISTAMHVLEDEHYLKRVRVYEKGKIVDWDYYLYDEPYPFDDQDDNAENSAASDSSNTENTHSSVFLPSQDMDNQDTDTDLMRPDLLIRLIHHLRTMLPVSTLSASAISDNQSALCM